MKDESSLSISKKYHYYEDLKVGHIEASGWQDFPSMYKFIGFKLVASDFATTTERKRYNVMDFAKELGGLMKVCMAICGIFVSRFGQANINSLLATEFYTWDIP